MTTEQNYLRLCLDEQLPESYIDVIINTLERENMTSEAYLLMKNYGSPHDLAEFIGALYPEGDRRSAFWAKVWNFTYYEEGRLPAIPKYIKEGEVKR